MPRQILIYGAGLIARELRRYLERMTDEVEILGFAVTEGTEGVLDGLPVYPFEEAWRLWPGASVVLGLQEKYHAEVRNYLAHLHIPIAAVYGLQRLTRLLQEEFLHLAGRCSFPWTVQMSPYDMTTLDLAHPHIKSARFTFYPVAQPPFDEVMEHLSAADYLFDEFRRGFGLPDMGGGASLCRSSTLSREVLLVGVACTPRDAALSSPRPEEKFLQPIWSGAALGGMLPLEAWRDDEGENVSSENAAYAELDVAYWLAHHAPSARYLGLCHYRRYFMLSEIVRARMRRNEVDVILPYPRLAFPSAVDFFTVSPAASLRKEDFALMKEVLQEVVPTEAEEVIRLLEGHFFYPNNMVIAASDIYEEYTHWLFQILTAYARRYREAGLRERPRYLGFWGEMLTSAYFAMRHEEQRQICTDYRLMV